MNFHREGGVFNVDKFVMIGAVAVLTVGSGLWGARTAVQQSLRQDNLEAPWIVAARAQQGASVRIERGYSDPVASREIQESVARWRKDNAR